LSKIILAILLAPSLTSAADIAISALPAASTVNGADVVPIVQSGTTKKASFTVQTSFFDGQYAPLARTLTIAGVNQSLAANRTWTTSTILDGLTSVAQGDILFKGASGWQYLAPSTDGFVLTTHGASSNPTWAAGTGFAPSTAHYLTNQAESGLSAEINLGALSTGLLKGTVSTGVSTISSITDSSSNWDTAFTDRLKWDGGATGLTAATGRTSLGGTTVGQAFFTLTNPSAITFPRINADNSVSALDASTFRSAIGAGTGGGDASTNTSVSVDGEVTLFNGTSGKSLKRGTGSGIPLLTSGVLSIATGGSDYANLTFKTVAVSGQSDVVADSAADTLTFAAGSNITLTTNAGTDTVTIAAAGGTQSHAVTFVIDGSAALITAGTKQPVKIPFGGTLTGWLLIASPSGSVTVDIFRAADGAGLPVTSIIGGSGVKPALSSAVENSSTSFTSWTSTTLIAKDNMAVSISGVATITYCALTLYYQ
jgi:hypothetical protein